MFFTVNEKGSHKELLDSTRLSHTYPHTPAQPHFTPLSQPITALTSHASTINPVSSVPTLAAIQLYGSLIVGQSILVYTLRNQLFTPRNKPSRDLRQGVCLAYCVVFALSTALVLKAQLAGVMNVAASVNSVLFVSLAGAYGLLFFRGMSGAPSKHTAH